MRLGALLANILADLELPQLPDQRGFYDDIRPFQRRDVKVQTEAFAPTPRQQIRTQTVVGLVILAFLAGTAGTASASPCARRRIRRCLWANIAGTASAAHSSSSIPLTTCSRSS